jgi:hypothetical protein
VGARYVYAADPADARADPGGAAGDMFGLAVGALGDLDADGCGPRRLRSELEWVGRVSVFRGGPAMDSVADLTIDDTVDPYFFGTQVCRTGDVTGDGYDDFLVSNAYRNGEQGRVYLFNGGPGLDNVADSFFDNPESYGHFGRCMAPAGDFNGDGHQEFAIAAPYSTAGGTYSGRFWVLEASLTEIATSTLHAPPTPAWRCRSRSTGGTLRRCAASASTCSSRPG